MKFLQIIYEFIQGTINKFILKIFSDKVGSNSKVHKFIWSLGIRGELFYQRRFIKTINNTSLLKPDTQLQGYIRELLTEHKGSKIKILDVGAGSLTLIGKKWDDKQIEITAIDPLADKYNDELKKYKVIPLVVTQVGHAEKLDEQFEENYFDIVHAINSLDHCYNPVIAIQQMLKVVKKDYYVVLHHHLNEGKEHNYSGLHQWNFYESNGIFYISNEKLNININKEFEELADINTKTREDGVSLLVTFRKK